MIEAHIEDNRFPCGIAWAYRDRRKDRVFRLRGKRQSDQYAETSEQVVSGFAFIVDHCCITCTFRTWALLPRTVSTSSL